MSDPAAALPERERRRSFRLGVWNSALYMGGEGLVDANTVVPVFLAGLGTPNWLIGFAAALPDFGWFLPQFATVPLLSRRARSIGLYRLAAVLRGLSFALLAALIVPLAAHPAALLATFLACYGIYSFSGGLAAVPFMEVVGRTVPRERLGAFWAQRLFWGGITTVLAGLLVRHLLHGGTEAPRFALLFGLATVLVTAGYALFSAVREPELPPTPERAGPLGMLREGGRLLAHDAHFRRLLVARGTLSAWFAAAPFITLFAVRELGGSARTAGTFLLVRMAGFVVANLLWHRVSRRQGDHVLMRIGAAGVAGLTLAAALVALLSPWQLGWLGAAQSATVAGYSSLMLTLAPPGRRQAFIGLINTFLGPIMLLPMLGGWLVDRLNAPALFALCAVAALVGVRAAWRLPAARGPATPEAAGEGERPGHAG